MLFWLENGKSQSEERLLWMPLVESTVHSREEHPFEQATTVFRFRMQAWKLSFHDRTSCEAA